MPEIKTVTSDQTCHEHNGVSLQRRRVEWIRSDLLVMLCICAIWLLMVLLVNPSGNFPLNDDWAYGRTVKYLLDHGEIKYCGWNSMVLIAQVLWGALFCLLFGFSFNALRLSTLVMGALGCLATYGLLREMKASRRMALLGCLVVAANPIYFNVSNTFMTDVPFFALATLSVYLLVRGLGRESRTEIVAGIIVSILAVFIRQSGLAIQLAFGFAYLWKKGLRIRNVPPALLPTGIAGALLLAFQQWLKAAGRLPDHWYQSSDILRACVSKGAMSMLTVAGIGTLAALIYVGLFLLPFLIAGLPHILQTGTRRQKAISVLPSLTFVVAATRLLATQHLVMPFLGNIWCDLSLGPASLRDTYLLFLPNLPTAPKEFWIAATAAAILGGGLVVYCLSLGLLLTFGRRADDGNRCPGWTLILGWSLLLLYWIPLALVGSKISFDRYYLPLLPFLMMLLVPVIRSPGNRIVTVISLLLITLYAAFSIGGTHDYLAWNRARWEALNDLMKSGVPARQIDGGFEFNGWYFYDPLYRSKRFPKWWYVQDDLYTLSFGDLPGYEEFREYSFRRWIPPGDGRVLVLRRLDEEGQ